MGWWVDLKMKNTIHNTIGWCAGLAIGMTIGVSQNNLMLGIGLAILGGGEQPNINQEWKEVLLLVLGAFLGSYSRIIDFWFNTKDDDGVPGWSEPPAQSAGPHFCDNCGDKIEYKHTPSPASDMPEEW